MFITTELLKLVVAHFDTEELITPREQAFRQANDLTEHMASCGLTLDDLPLTHLTFRKFREAVEAMKQEIHQEIQKTRFAVKTEERKMASISAQGGSKTAKLIKH